MKDDKKCLIVDVRKKKYYERIRIPGSLNIRPYALKSKKALQGFRLILVNNGFNYGKLEKVCNDLRNIGFKVQQAFFKVVITYHRSIFANFHRRCCMNYCVLQ